MAGSYINRAGDKVEYFGLFHPESLAGKAELVVRHGLHALKLSGTSMSYTTEPSVPVASPNESGKTLIERTEFVRDANGALVGVSKQEGQRPPVYKPVTRASRLER